MALVVDAADDRGPLPRFWRSTGFTPADLLLDPDAAQAATYMGSVPHGGLEFVRIHYLLDLVDARGLDADPEYDFSRLDRGLDVLTENGLRPVFELMGNPGGWFEDFTDDADVRAWRRLVRDLVAHLTDRYGREAVESWYFETWNEPDIGFGWEQFETDPEAFLRYYDACDAGLRDADGEFTLGGPGTARTRSDLFDRFVAHCDGGTNHLTGDPVRLDFVSVHEKGRRHHDEDLVPDVAGTLDRERAAVDHLRESHPDLATRPFWNDECDPQTGWVDTHTWRARPYYAATLARFVGDRTELLDDGVDYGLLSSDNAFLGTWGQRTQFARFGDGGFETDPNRATVRPHFEAFELVKKPIHNAFVALSLLGERRVAAGTPADDDTGVIATRSADGTEVTVLLYRARDRPERAGTTGSDLRIESLPFDAGGLARYRIDEAHGNPFREWDRMDAPAEPTATQYARLRSAAEFAPVETTAVSGPDVERSLELPLPGLHLVHLRADPGEPPSAPRDLRARTYPGRTFGEDVLLSWTAPGRAVATYEVLAAPDPEGPFERVNDPDLIGTAFLDAQADEECPYYAVRAVDYWGRRGDRSPVCSVA